MRVWSVEAERGGFTLWEDQEGETADDARAAYEKLHPDAKVRAVSEVIGRNSRRYVTGTISGWATRALRRVT